MKKPCPPSFTKLAVTTILAPDKTNDQYWTNPLQDVIGTGNANYDSNEDSGVNNFNRTEMHRVR